MDLKELKALLKVLRQNGILHYKSGEVDITLSPDSHLLPKEEMVVAPEEVGFPQGILSDEQLAYYSAGGLPSEDPELEEPN